MRDTLVKCPFDVLIDSAEVHPYTFQGIRADANKRNGTFTVRWYRTSLGRHPLSYGDYSMAGGFGRVAIERKSMEDAWGTLLGWPTGWEQDRGLPGRRDRFERELANLNGIDASLIVVEATLGRCLEMIPQWGVKPAEVNRKIFFRTVLSYQQRFPRVQWQFCDTRRLAEVTTFRWLYRFWAKQLKGSDCEWMGDIGGQDSGDGASEGDLVGRWDWV